VRHVKKKTSVFAGCCSQLYDDQSVTDTTTDYTNILLSTDYQSTVCVFMWRAIVLCMGKGWYRWGYSCRCRCRWGGSFVFCWCVYQASLFSLCIKFPWYHLLYRIYGLYSKYVGSIQIFLCFVEYRWCALYIFV
jgi:hypothetical protein